MAIKFEAKNHSYTSVDPLDKTEWLSVTSLVSQFKQPFDDVGTAEKVRFNKKSKWYGMSVQEILDAWKSEGKRATDLGTWYHNQREVDVTAHQTLQRAGIDIPIIKPLYDGDIKLAPEQRLVEGIYPEHFTYLKSAGICGQSDRVEVVRQHVDIIDYKTNKEIKTQGFVGKGGKVQKMLHCLSHLDDCSFNHYTVQLSMYMYMILKHNPNLRPGKMALHHIVFEEDGVDKYGYPIAKRNDQGDPIVKEIKVFDVPYLKTEVIGMINWLHDNRHNLTKKH